MKPFAESCLRNQEPILSALKSYLGSESVRVLELGSGTGQHGVHFTSGLSDAVWQPSDIGDCLPGISAWCEEAGLKNLLAPIELDVDQRELPGELQQGFDAVFMANTLHFVANSTASNFMITAKKALKGQGLLFIYGPFNDAGRFTSEGNQRLEHWLKERDPSSGIKDLQWLVALANKLGFEFLEQKQMPANNLFLVFRLE